MTPGPQRAPTSTGGPSWTTTPCRTPDRALTVFEGRETTYGEMARRAGRWPRASRPRRRRGDVVGTARLQLPRVPGDRVRRQPPRRDGHAHQLAAGRAGGAVHPGALRGQGAGVRRGAGRPGHRGHVGNGVRPCVPACGRCRPGGWMTFEELRGTPRGRTTCRGRRGRRPPPHVHVGDDRPAQGGHDHPRQPGLEEPGPPRRVRIHGGRSRARLWTALPRGRPGPHDHITDRGGCHRDRPPDVRRRSRGRRARAVSGHHRVVGSGDGQRHHGPARRRAARPVVGPAHHQRWGEDADPPHRADPADVPVGVVRRRLRAHGDRVGGHVPRPGQHHHQTRQRRAPLPLPRARHLGRTGKDGAARRSGRDRAAGPQGIPGILEGPASPPRQHSPAVGSTPGTSASATRTATCSSSTA